MTIRDKIKTMGFGLPKIPDIGEITRLMDERFAQLTARLDEMLVVLREIRDDGRAQSGG